MKLCSMCNKNIATVYTAKIENGKPEMIGLCMDCAKKMGVPIIDQLMKQAGVTPEDMENLSEQMNNMLQDINIEDINSNSLSSFLNGTFPESKDMDKDESKTKKENSLKVQKKNQMLRPKVVF